jgi:hypothetical protein
MRATNVAGERSSWSISTRLVGLPRGTAIEAAFATATTPRSSGPIGAAKRSARTSSTGTISTTAASSDTAQVNAAHSRHTDPYRLSVLPRALTASAQAVRSVSPERSTNRASVNAALRNATSGASTETTESALAPKATSAPASTATSAAAAALRGRHASSATARTARMTRPISIVSR